MKKIFVICVVLGINLPLFSQSKNNSAEKEAAEKALKNANNPLANSTAFNVQNYYYAKLAGTDEIANTSWLRFVSPIGKKIIFRASVPIPTKIPANQTDYKSGIGNINVFGAYILNKPGAPATIGTGPLLVTPCVTDGMGTDKWQLGGAFVYFNAKSLKIQWGGLVTYQHSLGSNNNDQKSSVAAIQPFYFFQIGKGTYLRGAPIWLLDFEHDAYNIPFGLGLGKVIKVNGTVFNIFLEPQFTMFNKGNNLPLFAMFGAINMQFMKKK